MAAKKKQKWVVRRGGAWDDVYLQADDGTWGPYKTAKRFTDVSYAERVARLHIGENFGLFPVGARK